jgi:undecaprenyl-diphosphatase
MWLVDLILAIIQGITEIYPISSSAHIVVAGAILGHEVSFNKILLLHIGSVAAIAYHYRSEVINIICGRYGWKIVMYMIASVVLTGIIGLSIHGFVESVVSRPGNTAYLWLFNGLLLGLMALIIRPGNKEIAKLTFRDFLWLGLAQGIGAIPGISRLGIMLGAALLRGLKWPDAIAISFILGLPVIILGNIWRLMEPAFFRSTSEGPPNNVLTLITPAESVSITDGWLPLFVIVITFIVSWLSLIHLTRIVYLGRRLLIFFALYCFVAGVFFPLFLRLFK